MRQFLSALVISTSALITPAFAFPKCMEDYHVNHDRSCLEEVAKALRANDIDGDAITGFMAETLRKIPESRKIFSIPDLPPRAKATLDRAYELSGDKDNDKRFRAVLWSADDESGKQGATARPGIDTATSFDDINTNDLLLGAFMASGDQDHLARILKNFDHADAQLISNAIRQGSLLLHYWTRPTQIARRPIETMMKIGCARYQCKPGTKTGRLATLATAYWAFFIRGRDHRGYLDALAQYRKKHPKFAVIEAQENAGADNYVFLSIAYTNRDIDPALTKAFEAYESFSPLTQVLPSFNRLAEALPNQ